MQITPLTVRMPPPTDKEALLGNYGCLFSARGIEHPIPFTNPTPSCHPIAESAKILLDDFIQTSETLKTLTLRYESVRCDDVKVLPTQLLFKMELGEEFGTVISIGGPGL